MLHIFGMRRLLTLTALISPLLISLVLSGCGNPIKKAVQQAKYSGYEMIGVEKRDLLKRRISETRDDQKEAAETFEDALDKLRRLYGMKSSKLERQYRRIQASYDESQERAVEVRESHQAMKTVAQDLFKEWEDEIKQIQSTELKSSSREKLKDSRAHFAVLDESLTQAEQKMEPVLTSLKDHVLYLKHNLNAESLSALKKEHDRIGNNIEALVKDMNKAIKEADQFIGTLP